MRGGNNNKLIVGAIAVVVILSIADPRIGKNVITYMILGILVIIGFMGNTPQQPSSFGAMAHTHMKKKPEDDVAELGEKEKKFLIFYLLTELERKESIDMGELTAEFSISIYELNNIIRLLGKHGAIEVVYPPLQNFPLIRKGNPEVSKKYRISIYQALAKKDILGETSLEDFAREVSQYLDNMRRG
jgi:hypothetical protein